MIWVTLAIGLFGGGIIVYFFDWLKNRGKIILDKCNLKLSYSTYQLNHKITHFSIDLQFINTSGHQAIVKDLSTRFYDGQEYHEFSFDGYSVPPADIIEARKIKTFQFILKPYSNDIDAPLISIYYKTAHLEFKYTINNSKKVLFIENIQLDAEPERWIAF